MGTYVLFSIIGLVISVFGNIATNWVLDFKDNYHKEKDPNLSEKIEITKRKYNRLWISIFILIAVITIAVGGFFQVRIQDADQKALVEKIKAGAQPPSAELPKKEASK